MLYQQSIVETGEMASFDTSGTVTTCPGHEQSQESVLAVGELVL